MRSSSRKRGDSGAEGSLDEYPRVFGKYVLLRPMARGGMGELFLSAAGEVGGFEKLCVVKKVLGDLEDDAIQRRFLDEAKVVVRLNHANLVQVFDAGGVGPEYYLAMELVEGKDLRAVWNRCAKLHRRIPVDVAIFTIREVARALAYAHDAMELELVHRDISPPNILLSYHGDVKLTDFGLAKSAIKREMTNPGVVFGRYSYLSPEQAKGMPADRRTDIYAAAIVLWELLTGRQLFPTHARGHQEALAAVRDPKVKPPSTVVPGVPKGLDAVVMRALAPERAARYATAGEFRAALSEILARDFPTCDRDRVAEFMREIFVRERRDERSEYEALAQRDFGDLRSAGRDEDTQVLSISDVITMEPSEGLDVGELVEEELGEQGLEPDPPDPREGAGRADLLRAAAERWIGTLVAGKYRVEGILGIGGMGTVFHVTHEGLGKPFALKVLHRRFTRNPDIVARFTREARAASQTGHPNIIDVVDIGQTEDGDTYFVMELLEGVNLGELIRREGALPVRRAVHILLQIARALEAAHEVGIIHRDLKSDNVFLITRNKDADFVKVLDFGICKSLEDGAQTAPGMVMGSPDYMAPEQAAGRGASVASDVYAVGCVLFELLTGRVPYEGHNAIDVLMRKSSQEAPPVTGLRPEIPAPVAEVVRRCLRRRPEERPASMRMVEYELTRAVEGRAQAVAAVLGLAADPERPDMTASASDHPARALPATLLESTDAAGPMAPAAVAAGGGPMEEPADPWSGGGKAILFVVLGVLLAGGVLLAAQPAAFGLVTAWIRGEDPVTTADEASLVAASPPSALPARAPAGESVKRSAVAPAQAVAEKHAASDDPPPPPTAAELEARAEAALVRGHWREPAEDSLAMNLAQLALLDPRSEAIARLRKEAADQLLPRAEKLAADEEWAAAAEVLRDLVAVAPDQEQARALLAKALARQGKAALRAADADAALSAAEEWINVAPDAFAAHVLRAEALAAKDRWSEAREAYGRALELRPRDRKARKALRAVKRAEARAARAASSRK